MHAEWRSEGGADDIVDAGVVGAVGKVKSLRGELEGCLLPQFERAAEAPVELVVVGAKSGVASGAARPVVGEMSHTIDVPARNQTKGLAAVQLENRRELGP